MDDCVAMLAHEVQARGATVRLGELPTVLGDASLLNGLFTNLILNALKYSPRTGSEIVVDASREQRAWRVAVESEGQTIPPEDRQRIFEPFQRGRSERRARGAGLGLTICRRIVERHGGQIGVAPPPRGGNRFYFTLARRPSASSKRRSPPRVLCASATASARVLAPSLRIRFLMCERTVSCDSTRASAISSVVWP